MNFCTDNEFGDTKLEQNQLDKKINEMKTEFENIKAIRSSLYIIFETLRVKINKLKNMYSEFIQENNSTLFVFGLDSFNFQSNLISIEFADMNRIFLAISNRMYCEYYKLCMIVMSYLTQSVRDKNFKELIAIDKKKFNNFPVYKDLEPYKEYNFDTVLELHDGIFGLIEIIIKYIKFREQELSVYQNKLKLGLNIDNFISSFKYDINLMSEKVCLFLKYIDFFHKLHKKYLLRFSKKMKLMFDNVNKDIRIDETHDIKRQISEDSITDTDIIEPDNSVQSKIEPEKDITIQRQDTITTENEVTVLPDVTEHVNKLFSTAINRVMQLNKLKKSALTINFETNTSKAINDAFEIINSSVDDV
jgi:hypothetical protein